jgi:hypothetical protein
MGPADSADDEGGIDVMARWRRKEVLVAVALAVGLAGCSGLPAGVSSDFQQAQADLARWSDAVTAAGGQTAFVPVDDLTNVVGDWGPELVDTGKQAIGAGLFETTVALPTEAPADGELRWQSGSSRTVRLLSAQQAFAELKVGMAGGKCSECTPLQITGATLTAGSVQTSRGPANVPLWEFTLKGSDLRVTRVAVADKVTVVPPAWDPNNQPTGMSIQSATGTASGKELTVSFTGAPKTGDQACGADYTAEAVESATAVVVIVTEHSNALPVACTLEAAIRTAVVSMASALGDRTVLEVREGRPVSTILTS